MKEQYSNDLHFTVMVRTIQDLSNNKQLKYFRDFKVQMMNIQSTINVL